MKFDQLTNEQKEFITKKVSELGSIEAVESFYSPHPKAKDQTLSVVDQYARSCIPNYWRKGGTPK